MITSVALCTLGAALIFVGVLIIILALVLLIVSGTKRGKVKGGGAIIIGFVPIVFGTDEKALRAVLLISLMLTVIFVVVMLLYYLLLR